MKQETDLHARDMFVFKTLTGRDAPSVRMKDIAAA